MGIEPDYTPGIVDKIFHGLIFGLVLVAIAISIHAYIHGHTIFN